MVWPGGIELEWSGQETEMKLKSRWSGHAGNKFAEETQLVWPLELVRLPRGQKFPGYPESDKAGCSGQKRRPESRLVWPVHKTGSKDE